MVDRRIVVEKASQLSQAEEIIVAGIGPLANDWLKSSHKDRPDYIVAENEWRNANPKKGNSDQLDPLYPDADGQIVWDYAQLLNTLIDGRRWRQFINFCRSKRRLIIPDTQQCYLDIKVLVNLRDKSLAHRHLGEFTIEDFAEYFRKGERLLRSFGSVTKAEELRAVGGLPKIDRPVHRSSTIQRLLQQTRSAAIPMHTTDAMDGLVTLWMSHDSAGLPSEDIRIQRMDLEGFAPQTGLPPSYSELVAPYWSAIEREIGLPNRSKVWISKYRLNMSDRPGLELTIGRTNYWTTKCLERAFGDGLARRYEESDRIFFELPHMVVPCAAILTSDQRLIMARRKQHQTDYGDGFWTTSFAEQWDFEKDQLPHQALLRGLAEEFNIDPGHGIVLRSQNIRLIALAREWGEFWNVVMLYVVWLPATASKVLECWNAVPPPPDKHEHAAIAAVPIKEKAGKDFLLGLLERNAIVDEAQLKRVCGKSGISGSFRSHGDMQGLIPSWGRAEVVFGLWAAGCLNEMS